MIVENILKFLEKFPKGIYIKTIEKPYFHGLFTEKEPLKKAVEELPENTTLYFIGHELEDIDFVPINCFANIETGKSIKKNNIKKLKYLLLDIDPLNNTENVNGKKVYRNLTAEENQSILTQTIKLKQKLIEEGFDNIGVINSANGAYLFFPFTGLKNPSDNIETLKQFAEILKVRYGFAGAQIDTTTVKISQCFKVPGTLSSKGEGTEENPLRHAEIVEDWDAAKSCWDMIQDYVFRNAAEDLVIVTSKGTSLNITACMEKCRQIFPIFRGKNHEFFARVKNKNGFEDMLMDSADFERELRIYLRNATGLSIIGSGAILTILTYLKDEAYQKEISPLVSRAYYDETKNSVYYDLCNNKEIIEITSKYIKRIKKPLGMFRQYLTDKEQVEFLPTPAEELPRLLGEVSNVKGDDLIILATFLCVCFLGNCFPTPIMLITGAQGTSKSTLTEFIQRIVHPQKTSSLSLGAKIQDIAIALSTRLLTCFDNASGVKAEVADILCQGVTKGCFQTRELYTTADERLIEYVSIMVINGIDIISRRTDLMERCLMLEMEPISSKQRITKKEIEKRFAKNLPKILGAIFDAIQKVLGMGEIELDTLSRMADFEEWAVKFALVMNYTIQDYQLALYNNHRRLVDAVSFGNPVVFAVVELMRYKKELKMDFQKFYTECHDILKQKATPNEVAMFPKSPAALSRALGGMIENLTAFGITFRSENIGPNKEAQLTNDGSIIPTSSSVEIAGKISYETQKENQKSA